MIALTTMTLEFMVQHNTAIKIIIQFSTNQMMTKIIISSASTARTTTRLTKFLAKTEVASMETTEAMLSQKKALTTISLALASLRIFWVATS